MKKPEFGYEWYYPSKERHTHSITLKDAGYELSTYDATGTATTRTIPNNDFDAENFGGDSEEEKGVIKAFKEYMAQRF